MKLIDLSARSPVSAPSCSRCCSRAQLAACGGGDDSPPLRLRRLPASDNPESAAGRDRLRLRRRRLRR